MLESVLGYLSLAGVVVFAASGALAAAEKQLDILAYVFFAAVVGTGGGTLRDVLIDVPVFWVQQPTYLYVVVVTGIATYFTAGLLKSVGRMLIWLDAAGLALFSVLGAAKSLALGLDPLVAMAMGVITATFGSIIRDVILNREPLILEPEIYVTACLLGTGSYVAMMATSLTSDAALLAGVSLAFALRAGALIFDWRLPRR